MQRWEVFDYSTATHLKRESGGFKSVRVMISSVRFLYLLIILHERILDIDVGRSLQDRDWLMCWARPRSAVRFQQKDFLTVDFPSNTGSSARESFQPQWLWNDRVGC